MNVTKLLDRSSAPMAGHGMGSHGRRGRSADLLDRARRPR